VYITVQPRDNTKQYNISRMNALIESIQKESATIIKFLADNRHTLPVIIVDICTQRITSNGETVEKLKSFPKTTVSTKYPTVAELKERIQSTNNGYLFAPSEAEISVARANHDVFTLIPNAGIAGKPKIMLKTLPPKRQEGEYPGAMAQAYNALINNR